MERKRERERECDRNIPCRLEECTYFVKELTAIDRLQFPLAYKYYI